MPSCAVSSCRRTHRDSVRENVSFFHFPKDPAIIKLWVKACKRTDVFNTKTAIICSDHFKPEYIMGTLRRELLGEKSRRSLVDGAVPTENLTVNRKSKSQKRTRQAKREERYYAREVRKRALQRIKSLSPKRTVCESSPDNAQEVANNVELVTDDKGGIVTDVVVTQPTSPQPDYEKMYRELQTKHRILEIQYKTLENAYKLTIEKWENACRGEAKAKLQVESLQNKLASSVILCAMEPIVTVTEEGTE